MSICKCLGLKLDKIISILEENHPCDQSAILEGLKKVDEKVDRIEKQTACEHEDLSNGHTP